MKVLKIFGLMATILFGAVVWTSCGDDDDDPLGNPKSPADIEWAQHEYQIKTSGNTWSESKWDGYYASFFKKWNFRGDKDQKDGPRFFLSHYRWYPAKYGPTYWTKKLDNGDWYYAGRYSSHSYELETLSDGRQKVTFDMQGQTWSGILTDSTVFLTTVNGSEITLTPLPAKAYDGSYDEILKTIL